MQVGERLQVRAYKADGTCYRWWWATVEAVEPHRLVVFTPVGHRVEGIDGGWTSEYAIRAFYWFDRWYNLLEVYASDGRLVQIYANVGSPAEIENSELRFTDYELDVSRRPPHEARIVDEDEFLKAASRYEYSEELQQTCCRAAREAVEVVDGWRVRGAHDVLP